MRPSIWVAESFQIKGRQPLTEKLPESFQSLRFVPNRGGISGEYDSRKDLQSIKFERRPWIFAALSFREFCDSKLYGLHPFDNMTIIYWVEIERKAVRSWVTNPWSNFCDLHRELICRNKWHPGTSEISKTPEIAVGTDFHARTWHQNYPSIFTCW